MSSGTCQGSIAADAGMPLDTRGRTREKGIVVRSRFVIIGRSASFNAEAIGPANVADGKLSQEP